MRIAKYCDGNMMGKHSLPFDALYGFKVKWELIECNLLI